jgi:predicted transcriptional regulator
VTNDVETPSSLAQLTAEIVSAYVSNNKIAPSELGGLITTVAGQLSKVGAEPGQPAEEKPEPAESVRRSIRPDHLVCLICGRKQKLLKRHLAVEHELTPNQYREKFGLKSDYPMAAPNYAQQRRELAVKLAWGGQTSGAGGSRPPVPRRLNRASSQQPRPAASSIGRCARILTIRSLPGSGRGC